MSAYEAVLKELGSFGPFQRRVFILVSMFETPVAWAMLLPILLNEMPSWTCTFNDSQSSFNLTNTSFAYNQSSTNHRSDEFMQCQAVDAGRCKEVSFIGDFTSIISEWSLMCDRKSLASLITTLQFCGVLTGALITGQLADLYGRRKALFITYFFLLVFSFASSFVPYWQLYAVMRFIIGGLIGGVLIVNFVLPLEFVTPSWRTFCGCIGFWAVGLMTLAPLGYLIRDWRILTIVTSVVGIPMLFSWWFVPESPRWLLKMGRLQEAEQLLVTMAKYNCKNVPDCTELKKFVQEEKELQTEAKKHSYIDLFRSKTLAKNTLIVMYAWFVSSSVYYGLNLNLRNLAGDRYLNLFISGLVEIPALIVVVLVNNKLGRRKTISALMLIAGLSCFSILIVDLAGKLKTMKTLVIVLAMAGKFGISGGWAAVQVFSAETFPTVVRNIGIGACSMSARIGGILAPQFVILGSDVKPLLFTIFGCLATVCGIFVLFLPETAGKPLTDSLQQKNITHDSSKHLHNVQNGHTQQERIPLQETA